LLAIPRAMVEEIFSEARSAAPRECCGLLAGRDEVVGRRFVVANTEKSPTRYFMEPKEQLNAVREMRKEGLELLAIYHSHPVGPPYPSARDIQLAFYPETVNIIVSVWEGNVGGGESLRAFRIVRGNAAEVAVRIV